MSAALQERPGPRRDPAPAKPGLLTRWRQRLMRSCGSAGGLTVAGIREILDFLPQEYGLQEVRVHEEGMYTEVVWANDATAVHVTLDVRAGIFVDLVKRGAKSGRNSFDIEDIKLFREQGSLEEWRTPEGRKALQDMRSGSEKEQLMRRAIWLKEFAHDVLTGDFSIFDLLEAEHCRLMDSHGPDDLSLRAPR